MREILESQPFSQMRTILLFDCWFIIVAIWLVFQNLCTKCLPLLLLSLNSTYEYSNIVKCGVRAKQSTQRSGLFIPRESTYIIYAYIKLFSTWQNFTRKFFCAFALVPLITQMFAFIIHYPWPTHGGREFSVLRSVNLILNVNFKCYAYGRQGSQNILSLSNPQEYCYRIKFTYFGN